MTIQTNSSLDGNGSFDYPEYVRKDSIWLPPELTTFFKKTPELKGVSSEHVYIQLPKKDRPHEARLTITYSNIEGRSPRRVPAEYNKNEELIASTREYDIINENGDDRRFAEMAAENALKALFGKGQYKVNERKYMLHTSSTPIKIEFQKNGEMQRWPIYVKMPDTSRILGKWVYDIISGFETKAYRFNRAVFIEESIPGHTLWEYKSKMEERKLLSHPQYREGIIRANEHANFMEISDIVNSGNRIINGFDTVLFDFNLIFQGYFRCENRLLDRYLYDYGAQWFDKSRKDVKSIIQDERRKIAKRVGQNEEKFYSLIKIMEDIVPNCTEDENILRQKISPMQKRLMQNEKDRQTLRQKADSLGALSFEELLRERVEDYSKS